MNRMRKAANKNGKPERREVTTIKSDGFKFKQVKKKGVVKKTVTNIPGIKEKEVERGKRSKYVHKVKGGKRTVERGRI